MDKNSDENVYDEVNKIYEFDKEELEFNSFDIISNMVMFKPFKGIFNKMRVFKNKFLIYLRVSS